jgi:hypothetical protein
VHIQVHTGVLAQLGSASIQGTAYFISFHFCAMHAAPKDLLVSIFTVNSECLNYAMFQLYINHARFKVGNAKTSNFYSQHAAAEISTKDHTI